MTKKILSFDCAHRSLAWTYIVLHNKSTELNILIDSIEYFECGSIDLLDGKKVKETSAIERTKKLHEFLKMFNQYIIDYVYIEYQMGPNHKSKEVETGIMMHFAEKNLICAKPAFKNTIAFCPEGLYQNFIKKYSKTYDANKAHTKYNFTVFLNKLYELRPELKQNLNPKHMSDIADSFMQIFQGEP